MFQPLLLAAADLHITPKVPVCRTEPDADGIVTTQLLKISRMAEVAAELKIPAIYAGDTFNDWNDGHEVVAIARHMPAGFCVGGQHELPYHSVDRFSQSPLHALWDKVKMLGGIAEQLDHTGRCLLGGASWKEEPPELDAEEMRYAVRVCVMHRTIWMDGEPPFPGAPVSGTVRTLLNKYPQYNVFICGDNHKEFVYEQDGRIVINCGSMLRLEASQIDVEPAFFVLEVNFREDPVAFRAVRYPYIPKANLLPISREHIEKKQAEEKRTFAFLSQLKEGVATGKLNFKERLEDAIRSSQLDAPVERKIWEIRDQALQELK